MNKTLQDFARSYLKEHLAECTEKQNLTFKRIYSTEDLDADLETVVDNMSGRRLSLAMVQVARTCLFNEKL